MNKKERAFSALIAKCIEEYPEMDYIMFPKIEYSIDKEEEEYYENTLYRIRIRGIAIKIKLE